MATQNFRVKNGLEVGIGATILISDSGGNIGIGSTQPTSKLDVNGSVTATSFIGNATSATTATNVTLADESSDTICFPIFATDATGDQAPKTDSSALTYNASTGALSATSFSGDGSNLTGVDAATLDSVDSTSFLRSDIADTKTSGNLTFSDGVRSIFGSGGDLNIYHSSGFSYIVQEGSNDLVIEQTTDNEDIVIKSDNGSGSTTNYFLADGSTGEAILYHYGTQKLATKSNGIDVTGHTETDTLNVSGISTLGTVKISSGIVTASSGIVTYYGDGSNLINLPTSGVVPTEDTTNQAQFIPFFVGTASTDIAGISSQSLVFNPSTTTMGIGVSDPDATLEINVGTSVTALDVRGSAGQLFSVTNNLTSGSIFSVNDVSGIPSIDVDADGTIQLAPFGASEFVGVGLTNPQAKLHVDGVSIFQDDVSIGAGGTTTFFDVSTGNIGIGSTLPTAKLVVDGTDFYSPSDTFKVEPTRYTRLRDGAAPSFVGVSTQLGGTSMTLAGLNSGDLVLFMGVADTTDTPTPQTDGENWSTVPGITNNNNTSPSRAIFHKFATGSSITATFTSANIAYAMLAFRGVDLYTPFDVDATTSTGSSGMPDCPSITPAGDNSMIVAAGFLDDDTIASSVGAPTGYTLATSLDNTTQPTQLSTLMVAYKTLPSGSTEDPGAFTGTGVDQYNADTLALRPVTSAINDSFKIGRNGIEIDSENLVIDSSGMVGIKTDTPSTDLDVNGTLHVSAPSNLDDSIPHFQINNTGIVTSLFSVSNSQVLIDINTKVSGIVTATDGFTSGTGGPVEISVSGSTLTFNVVGVGSTSLTLS